jgi:hypothetical protein|tara:strand:+ start:331 stop:498 length:168 start_codon:yes stop_codon:yes gene_type:complete
MPLKKILFLIIGKGTILIYNRYNETKYTKPKTEDKSGDEIIPEMDWDGLGLDKAD